MMGKEQVHKIRNKIQRASMGYQAQVWDNGMFEIHNVKESDYNYIISQLRRVDEVTNVDSTYRYDFSKPTFGVATKIYTIRGNYKI